MKTTVMPLLSVAVMSAFSSAWGTEKYIKIDPTSGKPEYISKEDAKNVAGMPEEGKLCEIAFKDVLIPKVVTEADKRETKNVPGYEFDCNPSKECDEKNEREKKEKKIKEDKGQQQTTSKDKQKEIDRLNKLINPPPPAKAPTKEEKEKLEKEKEKVKKEKEKADAEIEKLNGRLKKFERGECALKYFVGAGGKEPGAAEYRLTVDDIKDRKIEHVVCTCQTPAGP
jgi:hypothetical protein